MNVRWKFKFSAHLHPEHHGTLHLLNQVKQQCWNMWVTDVSCETDLPNNKCLNDYLCEYRGCKHPLLELRKEALDIVSRFATSWKRLKALVHSATCTNWNKNSEQGWESLGELWKKLEDGVVAASCFWHRLQYSLFIIKLMMTATASIMRRADTFSLLVCREVQQC